MSIKPYDVYVFRENKWREIQSDALLPGDLASVGRTKEDSGVACDMLLVEGSAIVNEAMLSGESTPLLKESVELREGSDKLDMNGADRNNVLFSGTKALQVEKAGEGGLQSVYHSYSTGSTRLMAQRPMAAALRLSCELASAPPKASSSEP